MIQIYRATELPDDVPGMIVSDGGETAVLVNPSFLETHGGPFVRTVVNALLATSALSLTVSELAARATG